MISYDLRVKNPFFNLRFFTFDCENGFYVRKIGNKQKDNMANNSKMTTTRMSKGNERLIAGADIRARKYPLALELTMEEVINSERHGATQMDIKFCENAEGNIDMTVKDDGDGKADISRLTVPAEKNGGGTSMYAAGLRIAQLKRAGAGVSYTACWKEAGNPWFNRFSDKEDGTKSIRLDDASSPWKTNDEHGFVHKTTIYPENLAPVLDIAGVTINDIVPAMREIITVMSSQAKLDKIEFHVTAYDRSGKKVGESNSKEKADTWKSFVEVFHDYPTCTNYPPVTTVVKGENGKKDQNITMKFMYTKIPKNKNILNFPRWGVTSVAYVFFDVFGFYIPVPLHEALNKAAHGASQNGRIAIVENSCDDVDSRPTPASTRTSFVQTCPNYWAVLKSFRANKAAGWDQYIKEPAAPAPPPAPEPDAPEVVLPKKIYPGDARKEGETDEEHQARIKKNEASRKSKAAKKAGSRRNSDSSQDSSYSQDIPIPVAPDTKARDELVKIMGPETPAHILDALMAWKSMVF